MESKWKIPGFLIENRGYALHIDLKVCSLLGSDPVKDPPGISLSSTPSLLFLQRKGTSSI